MVEWLAPAATEGGVFVDCTIGGGGHASALLEVNSGIEVLGLDQDPEALEAARQRFEASGSKVRLVKANFGRLEEILKEQGYETVRAVLYDLGVSSPQLDRARRGFGYRSGSALDMRMDPEMDVTAADIVNNYSVNRLAAIFSKYGEERFALRIARAIERRRRVSEFTDGVDLAEVVKLAIPAATRRSGGHPAKRSFQALRIEVNDELGALSRSLPAALDALAPGGRLAVISYHSLEDRLVKRAMAERAKGCTCPVDLAVCVCGKHASVQVLTRKPVRPTENEIAENRRAASARMRVALKLEEVA